MLTEQDYLLICLAEEAAEVGHAVSKALRFGLDYPWPGKNMTNRGAIADELRDVLRLAERIGITPRGDDKGEKFASMMELSRSRGRLEPQRDPTYVHADGEVRSD